MMRTLWGIALALPLAACEPSAVAKGPRAVEITVEPIPLNREDATQRTVGRLAWRGGLALSADDPAFGGLSGLLVSPDGRDFLAVSDQGHWLSGRLLYDARGWIASVTRTTIGPLLDADGAPLAGAKRDGDAESLADDGEGGVLVAFERRHRILGYARLAPSGAASPRTLPPPPELEEGTNQGIEALTRLADGRLFALAEGLPGRRETPETIAGWLWTGEAWQGFDYRRRDLLVPDAAATLPDGDVVVLERDYSPFAGLRVRVTRVAAADLRPGALVDSQEIAQLRAPLSLDNFEAVAARRGANGETLLYLLSDDNFNGLQRTLLVLFALQPTASAQAGQHAQGGDQ